MLFLSLKKIQPVFCRALLHSEQNNRFNHYSTFTLQCKCTKPPCELKSQVDNRKELILPAFSLCSIKDSLCTIKIIAEVFPTVVTVPLFLTAIDVPPMLTYKIQAGSYGYHSNSHCKHYVDDNIFDSIEFEMIFHW